MTASCCPRARKPLGVAAAGALLAVLIPKCPMCLAAYLSFLGAAASWVVWLRPIGIALTVAGVALATWRYLSRSAPARPPGGKIWFTERGAAKIGTMTFP
jgi:hypothetical protein